MKITHDPKQTLAALRLAETRLDCRFHAPFAVLAIEDRANVLRGAVILNDYCDRNIELTCVGSGAFTRNICEKLAHLVFQVNGCHRITIRTRKSNANLIRMALRWGWKVEGILRRWYGNDDAVVMGMVREDCRLLDRWVTSRRDHLR